MKKNCNTCKFASIGHTYVVCNVDGSDAHIRDVAGWKNRYGVLLGLPISNGADGCPGWGQREVSLTMSADEKLHFTEGSSPDPVNHPAHYGGADHAYEAIKVIEAWGLDFCLGNVVKYISRAGKKSDKIVEDLEKAQWYLQRRIQQLKGK